MLKKLIASALSAIFLCSSVMLDRIVDTSIVRDVPLADNSTILNNNEKEVKDGSNGQYDIKATNSLGNYITHMAADHNSNNSISAAPLSTDGKFEVSSLEFDNVTGDISVCSSQTSSCIVEISFINDETGEMNLKVSQAVEAGEYVKIKAKADLFKLPQFYRINAQLIDKMGNPISNVFHENKYTQKIQEIIATDIHDFEPERVVNLDESEQTNFLVLKENTVKAIRRLVTRDVDWNDCDLYDKAKSNSDTYLVAILDAIDVVEDMLTVEPKVDKDALIRLIQGAVEDGDDCRRLIEMVEPKQGEWICEMTKSQDQARDRWVIERVVLYCSECKREAVKMTKFCPNCGCRMKGADDEEL